MPGGTGRIGNPRFPGSSPPLNHTAHQWSAWGQRFLKWVVSPQGTHTHTHTHSQTTPGIEIVLNGLPIPHHPECPRHYPSLWFWPRKLFWIWDSYLMSSTWIWCAESCIHLPTEPSDHSHHYLMDQMHTPHLSFIIRQCLQNASYELSAILNIYMKYLC